VELVAILLTDLPLDEARFHGLLRDLARSSVAGGISPRGLSARHSYGDAAEDLQERDILVRVERATKAPPEALHELKRIGFDPVQALLFTTEGDADSREDAWALLHLYAEELRGWILTRYLDDETAIARTGSEEGILRVPLAGAGRQNRAVLLAASTLDLLAP
jgi:hypothetical protein